MWSKVFSTQYVWYVVAIAVGAFGIVMYLYAGEVEDHRKTESELSLLEKEHKLLQDNYKSLIASEAASEAQRELLAEKLEEAQGRFEEARKEATGRFKELQDKQAQLASLAKQREAIANRLQQTEQSLEQAQNTPPVVEVRPPTDQEIQDAVCETTPYSDDAVEYVAQRLQSIYHRGIQVSDEGGESAP